MHSEHVDFCARFIVGTDGYATETDRDIDNGGPLEQPHQTHDSVSAVQLSHTAKWTDGSPAGKVGNLLPRMDITQRLVAQAQAAQPVGTARGIAGFPYKLKAVGFVDPWAIMERRGIGNSTLVSQDFEIVP